MPKIVKTTQFVNNLRNIIMLGNFQRILKKDYYVLNKFTLFIFK